MGLQGLYDATNVKFIFVINFIISRQSIDNHVSSLISRRAVSLAFSSFSILPFGIT